MSHSCGLTRVISFTQTLVQAILDIVEMESCQHSPNYGLLILWASLANAPLVSTRGTMGLISIRLTFFCSLVLFSLSLQFFTYFGEQKESSALGCKIKSNSECLTESGWVAQLVRCWPHKLQFLNAGGCGRLPEIPLLERWRQGSVGQADQLI